LKNVYRNIRSFANEEKYIKDYERFLEKVKGELNKNGSSIALRIFKDIGLMTIEGEEKRIEINEDSGDFNLYHSYVFKITRALYDTRSKFLNYLLKSIET
jgi:hypothetical protein